MRAALALLLLAAAPAARAGLPLAVAERQVATLEFSQPVARVAVTDPDVVGLQASGGQVRVTGLRAGRASVEVGFEDGASVVYDVSVAAARRTGPAAAAAPNQLDLAVGEERRIAAPGLERVLVEENGVARARVDARGVLVLGLVPGATSVVLVDAGGARTTWTVRVR